MVVTGAGGQLGWELVRALQEVGEVVPLTRRELDVGDRRALGETLGVLRPAVICNAAAYTAVDRAESEPALAQRINSDAVGWLGETAVALGAAVLHFSTDYVFDGTASQPYGESAAPNPIGVYGRTKFAGEQALAASGAPHLILRTSWVFSQRGHNFLRTVLRLARERDELRMVSDQVGSPTWARWLANASAQIVAALLKLGEPAPETFRHFGGILHLTGAGETSWYGLADAIIALDPDRRLHRTRRLVPIPTGEYPAPASRPAYSVLDCSAVEQRFGVVRPHWHQQVKQALLDSAA